jgi:hypothetical protein
MDKKTFSVNEIAELLAEPPRRVEYAVRQLRLKPADRVYGVRVFTAAQIEAIKYRLYGLQVRGTCCV